MSPSDLLLLDEPTNHLDLDAELWLEQWLQRYQGSLVLISHDRDFIGSNKESANIDQVIIVEEIKMNLISKTCLALGIIAFLSNLISSTGDADADLICSDGASVTQARNRSLGFSIRSGSPGQTALVVLASPIDSAGHYLDEVKCSFEYIAGYTGGEKEAEGDGGQQQG